MASIFQDETKMHYMIIGVLSLSIILLLTHMKQMQSKPRPQVAPVAPRMVRRGGARVEGYANTQTNIPTLSGTVQMSTPTATFDELIQASSEDSINALNNTWLGCVPTYPPSECGSGDPGFA